MNPGTVAHQVPRSMEISRQEDWSGLPFPSPGDLPDPGVKPRSSTLQADSLPSEPPGLRSTAFKPESQARGHRNWQVQPLLSHLKLGFRHGGGLGWGSGQQGADKEDASTFHLGLFWAAPAKRNFLWVRSGPSYSLKTTGSL